eukprot:419289_1
MSLYSTDPSEYSDMDTSSLLSMTNSNSFITHETLMNHYPVITNEIKNDTYRYTHNVDNIDKNIPLRRSKRKRKIIQYNYDINNINNFQRNELENLNLDELLALAMSFFPN